MVKMPAVQSVGASVAKLKSKKEGWLALNRKQLGSRIAEKRTGAGLTQKDLAKLIGVTPGAITQYENDQSTPSLERLEAMAQHLDCGLDYLVYGTTTEAKNHTARSAIEREALQIFWSFDRRDAETAIGLLRVFAASRRRR
jgi:transcriptional regulator with XRE-family HTH domain